MGKNGGSLHAGNFGVDLFHRKVCKALEVKRKGLTASQGVRPMTEYTLIPSSFLFGLCLFQRSTTKT
jgi:hypothetical protein